MKRFAVVIVLALALAILPACQASAQTAEDPDSSAVLQSNIVADPAETNPVKLDAVETTAPAALSSLVRHYGIFLLDGRRPVRYDIEVFGEENGGDGIGRYVTFSFDLGGDEPQCFRCELDHYPHVDTMDDGLVILDVNGDGYQDVYLDTGFSGHMALAVCYVFDPAQNEYNPVNVFDRLASPQISISQAGEVSVAADDTPGHLEPAPDGSIERWSEYRVEGTELVLIGYLTSEEKLARQDTFLT